MDTLEDDFYTWKVPDRVDNLPIPGIPVLVCTYEDLTDLDYVFVAILENYTVLMPDNSIIDLSWRNVEGDYINGVLKYCRIPPLKYINDIPKINTDEK